MPARRDPKTGRFVKVNFDDKSENVLRATRKANFTNFRHAAASIRKDWLASIKVRVRSAPPGQPIHTRPRDRRMKRAILFWGDEFGAVIGPRYSVMGESAQIHEFGGRARGADFPARPSGFPALERAQDRIIRTWQHSIGGP